MDKKMLELYSDFLIASTGLTTATALSAMTEHIITDVTHFIGSGALAPPKASLAL